MTAPLTRFARRRIVMAALALLACGTAAPTVQAAQVRAIPAAPLSSFLGSEFTDHRGRRQPLSQWKGKILIVNFWATWCAPCREEMPYFSRLHRKYAAQGVQFLGISTDPPDAVADFAAKYEVSYPLLIGGPGTIELARALGNHPDGLPYTLVLGRNGEPLLTRTGRLPESELEGLLEAVLKRGRVDK